MFHYFFSIFKRVLSLSKKVFIVIFVFGLIIGLFSHFIQKDKPQLQYNLVAESRKDIYKKLNDPELNKSLPTRLSLKTFRFMSCIMAGEACTNNPEDGDKNFKNSLFGKASQLMALPYMNPPASGTYWVMNTFQNAGFIPNTYAAEGIGFASIKPLMNLWKVFRDVTYMLMVLFLVAIGFMIMFRVKINPQTVISVENSLPKIAVSMILVTFSFAIAGFLIDLMYVLIALVISLMSNNGVYYDVESMQRALLDAHPGKIWDGLMGNPLGTVSLRGLTFIFFFGTQFRHFLGPVLDSILSIVVGIVSAMFLVPRIIEHFGITKLPELVDDVQILGESAGKLPGAILGIPTRTFFISLGFIVAPLITTLIIGILFLFTIIYIWFRIFAMLINSYIQIVMLIIFSPFLIVLELLPGSKMGFSQWIKNLFGELITFPVIIALFLVSNVLGTIIQQSLDTTTVNINNPLFAPPFLFGIDPKAFATIITIGLSLAIPDFVKMVKESIGAKGMGVSIGVGSFFSGGGTAFSGGLGLLTQFGSIKLALGMQKGLLDYLPFGKKGTPRSPSLGGDTQITPGSQPEAAARH